VSYYNDEKDEEMNPIFTLLLDRLYWSLVFL